MTHIGGPKGRKGKALCVFFFLRQSQIQLPSFFLPSVPAPCLFFSFRTSCKWLLGIGRSWFCVWGKNFWDFWGRIEWNTDSAIFPHRKWSTGWDPGSTLQEESLQWGEMASSHFLSGSIGPGWTWPPGSPLLFLNFHKRGVLLTSFV